MKIKLTALAFLSHMCIVCCSASEQRTWTDTQGRTFVGTFVEAQGAVIVIKRIDGKLFNVPVERMSEIDKTYVDEQKKTQQEVYLLKGHVIQIMADGVLLQGVAVLKSVYDKETKALEARSSEIPLLSG